MKFEHTKVFNFDGALRGMRNPLESWSKSDSYINNDEFIIGPNDLQLAQRLISAGSEHRKFMRQIFVSVDITAPMYWMAEFDTYKIGIVRDSTSFQHKGTSKEFEIEDFEVPEEDVQEEWKQCVPIRLDDLYRGWELVCFKEIFDAYKANKSKEEIKEIISNQGHSGMSYGLECAIVRDFLDAELGEYLYHHD